MSLLKAFVCQVILLGSYKLFLEQVVEEHLVPDELTRNCLVGFVCLLCFGIQLYTAGDDDNAEADENTKCNSTGTSAKKSNSAEKSVTHKTAGWNSSSRVTTTKPETTTREKKISPNDQQVVDSKEKKSSISPIEAENVPDARNSGIFVQFSPYTSDKVLNVNQVDKGQPEMFPLTAQTSYGQERTYPTIPVLNGFSETGVCEESDEDCIEIDQLVTKRSTDKQAEQLRMVEGKEGAPVKAEDVTEEDKQLIVEAKEINQFEVKNVTKEVEQLRTVETKEVEPMEYEDVTKESEQLRTVEAEEVEPMEDGDVTEVATQLRTVEADEVEDLTEVAKQLRTVEAEEVEAIEDEDVTEAVVGSEYLSTNEIISSTQDSEKTTTFKMGESSEAKMTNGITEESLNSFENLSSNTIEETESKQSVKDEREIRSEQDMILSSEPDEHTKDVTESKSFVQETSNSSSTSTVSVNDEETMSNKMAEASKPVKTATPPRSEKATVSATRQKAAFDVCVAPLTIDISFIYACH